MTLIPIYLRPNLTLPFRVLIGLSRNILPVHLPIKIFKVLLTSRILATYPAHFDFHALITLTTLCDR